LEDALNQADIAITGMKVESFIRANLSEWLQYYEQVDEVNQKLADTFEAISKELPDRDEDITKEHEERAGQLLKTLAPQINHKAAYVAANKANAVKALKKIEARAIFYRLTSKEAEKAAVEVLDKIEKLRREQFARAEHLFNLLSGVLKRLYRDKPDEYERFRVTLEKLLSEKRKQLKKNWWLR